MSQGNAVITGMGVVSPIGIGKDAYWAALFEGKSGIKPITLFDVSDLKVKVGGEITEFDAKKYLGASGLQDIDRASLLLLTASNLALEDAGLEITDANTRDTGVTVGTTFGSLYSISAFDRESLKEGPRYVNPSVFPSTVGNSPASRVGIRFKVKGFNSTISTGMCAALDAVEYARNFINLGRVKAIVCGSVEDFAIQTFLGFYKLNYLSGMHDTMPPKSCPFDRRRDGIVFSEGSTALILENEPQARERKAKIYARVLGTGSHFDTARFFNYDPKGIGMIGAMQQALIDAEIKPQDIDCIFANANSTKDADAIETKAVKEVFGTYAKKVPVTAIKSMLGETYSASGGLSLIAAIGALEKGLIPAMINYQEKDPDCDLNYVLEPLKKNMSKIMVNTFGPNGANTVLILGR